MLERLIIYLLENEVEFKRGIEIASEFLKMAGHKMTSPPIL